jgi:hypothetical protein
MRGSPDNLTSNLLLELELLELELLELELLDSEKHYHAIHLLFLF